MYFKLTCTHCGKTLKAPEENIGRRARCPYCRTMVMVTPPVADPSAIPVATARAASGGSSSSATASATVAAPRPAAAPAGSGAGESIDGTNVNMLWSGLVGLGMTLLWYAALWPFRGSRMSDLFWARGWIPPVEALLFFWSIAILIFKSAKIRRQKESMLLDVLPSEVSEEISRSTLDPFVNYIRTLPVQPSQSFLVNRVLRGLEHFRVRGAAGDVAGMLSSQSDIDSNAVSSSYTMIKLFIWAIPILGFIGTVQGLGDAVGGFSGSLDKAQDISVLKNSLNNITMGLAVAFDTTLIALVMSVILMIPLSSQQKSEDDLLNWVDEYCNENLLRRVVDGGDDAPTSTVTEEHRKAIQRAMDAALANHHAELRAWSQRMEGVVGEITARVADGLAAVSQQMTQKLEAAAKQAADSSQQSTRSLAEAATKLDAAVRDMVDRAGTAHTELARTLTRSAEQFDQHLAGVERGLRSLSDVLENLGRDRVVIEVQPRRRWFSFARKDSNGHGQA